MWKEYDIEIPLASTQLSTVKRWVSQFNREQTVLVANPKVCGEKLQMNAADVSTFLAYFANPSQSNEFDVFRLKAAAVSKLHELISGTRSRRLKTHYSFVLDGLEKRISYEGVPASLRPGGLVDPFQAAK